MPENHVRVASHGKIMLAVIMNCVCWTLFQVNACCVHLLVKQFYIVMNY